MKIKEICNNKKLYMELLFLADEQENMIDKYLDRGTMFVLDDNGIKAECVVTNEGNGILEIKNIAVMPKSQHKGYGRNLINFIEEKYRESFQLIRVGTGDSPATVPFYKKCGFKESYRVKNFFIDNYNHSIFECGVQLIDMVYFEKALIV